MECRALFLAGWLLLFGGGVAGSAHAAPKDVAPDPDAAQLRKALAMARTDSFYLVLDLHQTRLTLMLGGVPLRVFPYSEASLGKPRLGGDESVSNWAERTWRGGKLDPAPARERREIEVPKPGTEGTAPTAAIPPTVEETHAVPGDYRLRFDGGLSLEIRRSGQRAAGVEPGAWLRIFSPHRSDLLRLRLALSDEDVDTLYRCLPPDLPLIVVGRPD